MNVDHHYLPPVNGQDSAQGALHPSLTPNLAQLPPKARFAQAYKHSLVASSAATHDEQQLPPGSLSADQLAAATLSASAAALYVSPADTLAAHGADQAPQPPPGGRGPSPAGGSSGGPARAGKHPRDAAVGPRHAAAHFGLGDVSSSEEASEGAPGEQWHQRAGYSTGSGRRCHGADGDEEEEPDEDSAGGGLGSDPLRRSPKAVRLSTSKIQGRAEPRKPRIGPQFQAFVPPWPPGL